MCRQHRPHIDRHVLKIDLGMSGQQNEVYIFVQAKVSNTVFLIRKFGARADCSFIDRYLLF